MILRKITKIVAITRCHILKLKCTKFDFDSGSISDPAAGANSAPQTSYLDLKGLLLREGGSVAEWLACWTQAQKSLGSKHSRDAVG